VRILLTIAVVMLAGCAATAPVENGPPAPKTTGQALAQMACPHRIAEANAWVNHMPGPGRSPRELNVDVRLVESTDTAVMLKAATTKGDTLVLEIRTAPTAPVAGRVAYREPVPSQMYKKISFFCRGGEIHSIDKVEQVY
jgi:hypothetical protein